jgi:hypothetical protein
LPSTITTPGVDEVIVADTPVSFTVPVLARFTLNWICSPASHAPFALPAPPPAQVSVTMAFDW